MGEMSNEQAAEILERLAYDDSDKRNDYAVAMAISALRSGWVKTTDRLPTVDDGIIGGTGEPEVIAITKHAHGFFPDMIMVSKVCGAMGRKYYPYWMALPQLPKLPEVEE